jgi:hypothetical protein
MGPSFMMNYRAGSVVAVVVAVVLYCNLYF